jgi:hypothetical protein
MKIKFLLVASLALSASFISCKKNNDADNTDLVTHSSDDNNFGNSIDDVSDDANNVIDNTVQFSGKGEGGNGPAGVTTLCNVTSVLDSTATLRRLTLTFNGPNCWGTRNRVGVVVLTMPLGQHWKDQGAVLTVSVQALKITRISDGKSITVNGSYTITNVTGGRLWQLASLGTIIHDINSTGVTITFDNGSQRSWQVARRRTFTYNNGINASVTGTHTDGSTTGICEWGTNRFGQDFVTQITQPLVFRQDCNFRLVSGEVKHSKLAANVVATFGLDSQGNPTACPGATGNYYMKIVWTNAQGVVRTYIIPY